MKNEERAPKRISGKRKFLFLLIMVFLPLVGALVIAEIVLRIVPVPGVKYSISHFDALTGVSYYPGVINIYRNDRGDYAKTKINKWGYFDREYTKEKAAGITRIGFFGDSYTQALQVPLEETFHFCVGDSLRKKGVETLSFGVSGFSTYQSYLTCNKWADFFDLDMIVYVFCENDLGDQVKSIKKYPAFPYPLLKDGKLTGDDSFKQLAKKKSRFYYRFFDYLKANLLVVNTLAERIQLLSRYGVKMNVNEKDRFMKRSETDSTVTIYPPNLDQSDDPSLWPDSLRTLAINLETVVLLNWRNELAKKQKRFAVLYTPKNILAPPTEQNCWKPWLEKFCSQNGIPFIDPTAELMNIQEQGNDVYYDHYTRFGHQAVTRKFISWYLLNF